MLRSKLLLPKLVLTLVQKIRPIRLIRLATGDPAVPFDPSSILAALSSISAVLAGIMSALTGFVDWWQAQWATFFHWHY